MLHHGPFKQLFCDTFYLAKWPLLKIKIDKKIEKKLLYLRKTSIFHP